MAENWLAKLLAFLIVFVVIWGLGSVVFANTQIGFILGLVAAAAFVGVALRK